MKKRIIVISLVIVILVLAGLGLHLAAKGFDLKAALQNMHGG